MRTLALSLALCLAVGAASALEPEDADAGKPHDGRPVLGGSAVDGSGWPWMLALLLAGEEDPYYAQFCAGTLISPRWVLSAAHCFYGYQDDGYEVLIGTTSLRPGLGRRVGVDRVLLHPAFVPPDAARGIAFDNDLALLHLAAPVSDVPTVRLPAPGFDAPDLPSGSLLTLRGWGATRYDGEDDLSHDFPDLQREVQLPLLGFAQCAWAMGESWFSRNMLCAGYPEGGRDTCQGDSGGPLVAPGRDDSEAIQIGIVSWGIGCGIPGYYGVYTRVSKYLRWITATVCDPADIPAAPRVELLSTNGNYVLAGFSSSHADSRFRVYYADSETLSPIRHLDTGGRNYFSASLRSGLKLKFAVQSYRGVCNSAFSTIHELKLPSNTRSDG